MTEWIVSVDWISPEDGGRGSLPGVSRYVTIGRFPQDGAGWPDGAWSVVLDFDPPPSRQGSPSRGRARFLMETAPLERLHPGARFELYEGLQRVAHVEVLELVFG